MTVAEINKIWGKKFLDTLTIGNAAIVFAFGIKKDGKVIITATTDLTPAELKKELQKIIENI